MRALFIGGGKSGKSTAAQRLAASLAGGGPLYYWATMTPHDGEDEARIQRHRDDRAGMEFVKNHAAWVVAVLVLGIRRQHLHKSAAITEPQLPPGVYDLYPLPEIGRAHV